MHDINDFCGHFSSASSIIYNRNSYRISCVDELEISEFNDFMILKITRDIFSVISITYSAMEYNIEDDTFINTPYDLD